MFLRTITRSLLLVMVLGTLSSVFGFDKNNCGTIWFNPSFISLDLSESGIRTPKKLPDQRKGLGWKRYVTGSTKDPELATFYEGTGGFWFHGVREYGVETEQEALMHEIYWALTENVVRGIYFLTDYKIDPHTMVQIKNTEKSNKTEADKMRAAVLEETKADFYKVIETQGVFWFTFTDEIDQAFATIRELEFKDQKEEADTIRKELIEKVSIAYAEHIESKGQKPFIYGEKKTASAEEVRKILNNPDDFTIAPSFSDDPSRDKYPYRLVASGYTFPGQRGVILYEDAMKAKFVERADNLLKEGITVTVNQHLPVSLFFLAHYREGEGAVRGITSKDPNRYRDPHVVNKAKRNLEEGRLYAFMSWQDIDSYMNENPDVARAYLNSSYADDSEGQYIIYHDGKIEKVNLDYLEYENFVLPLVVRMNTVINPETGETVEKKQVLMAVIKGVQMGNIFGPDAVGYQPSSRELDRESYSGAFRNEIQRRYEMLKSERVQLPDRGKMAQDRFILYYNEEKNTYENHLKLEAEKLFAKRYDSRLLEEYKNPKTTMGKEEKNQIKQQYVAMRDEVKRVIGEFTVDEETLRARIEKELDQESMRFNMLVNARIVERTREIKTEYETLIKAESQRRYNEEVRRLQSQGTIIEGKQIGDLKKTIALQIKSEIKEPNVDRSAIEKEIEAKLWDEARTVGIRNLDLAHMLNTAMSDILHTRGIDVVDTHMTSPFSSKRGAKYIPADYFQERLDKNPREKVVLTPGQWTPSWWKKKAPEERR